MERSAVLKINEGAGTEHDWGWSKQAPPGAECLGSRCQVRRGLGTRVKRVALICSVKKSWAKFYLMYDLTCFIKMPLAFVGADRGGPGRGSHCSPGWK